jgi:hypothetical protein
MKRIIIIGDWAFRIGEGTVLECATVKGVPVTMTGAIMETVAVYWQGASSVLTQYTETELDTIKNHLQMLTFQIPDNRITELPSSEIGDKNLAAMGLK